MIRNPIPWPNGAKCAVAISFDMDSDSTLHLEHHERGHRLVSPASWLRYDDAVAIPRILDMYQKYGIKQTFFIPGWCMEQYPASVEKILEAGHEIAHHGYLHEAPNGMPEDQERYWFERALDVHVKMTGRKPRGFRAPLYNFSDHTARLLAEHEFVYDSSLMGDDIPYLIEGSAGRLVELPTHWALDDWPHYMNLPDADYLMPIKSPRQAMEVYLAEFEAAWEFGGLWLAVWHPYLSGRLARAAEISRMIRYMMDKGSVWFAPLEEIARHVNECVANGTYQPRVDAIPFHDEPIPELPLRREE